MPKPAGLLPFIPHDYITPRQFAWIAATLLLTTQLTHSPNLLANVADRSSIFSFTLGIIYVLVLGRFFFGLIQRYPGEHLFTIISKCLGSVMGRIVNLVILFYFTIIFARDLRFFSIFINESLLSRTPELIVILLLVLILIYYAADSVLAVVRINEFTLPILIIIIVVTPFMLIPEMNYFRSEPGFLTTISEFTEAQMLSWGWAGDLFILGAFLHFVTASSAYHTAIRYSGITAGILLSASMFVGLLVLSSEIMKYTVFPFYSLIEQIHLTDFLDRMDIFLFSIWFPAFLVKMALLYHAILIGVSSFINAKPSSELLYKPIGLILIFLSMIYFDSIRDLQQFSIAELPIWVAVIQLPILLLLWLFSRKQEIAVQRPKASRRAAMLTNLVLSVSVIALLIGLWGAGEWMVLTRIVVIVYFLSLLGACALAFREIKFTHQP